MKKKRSLLAWMVIMSLLTTLIFSGCTQKSEEGDNQAESTTVKVDDKEKVKEEKKVVEEKEEEITLTFQVFSKVTADYFEEINITEQYKKVKPNVTLEIIRSKDGEQMAQDIKIKKAANELPDLMGLMKEWVINLKEDLVPLNDLECVKKSPTAIKNEFDGNILAISNSYFTEFVFYSKSIFAEYNLDVPRSWDEFINAATTIRDGGKYIPILLGAKDTWPLYPYNEQMPVTESGNGKYWNQMSTEDRPFAEGTPNYTSHLKIQKLFDEKVFGPDPLGMGWDQVKVMFGNQGAMMAAGQWYLGDAITSMEGNKEDIGVFFLPTRENPDDTQNYLVLGGDGGMSISKTSEHIEEAKEVIEWINSKDFLPGLCIATSNFCIFDDYNVTLDPIFDEAFEGVTLNKVLLDSGNEDYVEIRNSVQYSATKVGQEMLAGGDLMKILNDLDNKWEAARKDLNK